MNVRFSVSFLLMYACSLLCSAQKYISETGTLIFFSDAAIEDIKAENKKAASLINIVTSEIAFSVPIKEFQFEKSLMQEHFNEKYMESDKYPKASFQGKIDEFDINKTGIQNVKAIGKMTIHGVTKEIIVPGTLQVHEKKITLNAKFIIPLKDYNVTIPKLMWQNIAEEVEVSVNFIYKPQ